MDILAQELNQIILKENPYLMEMMSSVGKHLYFPKGILSQGAEAKEKAHKANATIGIATENHIPVPLVQDFPKPVPDRP